MRISASRALGDGGAAGLAGTDLEVQPANTPSISAVDCRQMVRRLAPVIPKLQLDLEILALEKGDDSL